MPMAHIADSLFLKTRKETLLSHQFETESYTEWCMSISSRFLTRHSFMTCGRVEKVKDSKEQSNALNFLQKHITMDLSGGRI